ncbi:putative repeat protein (TIGR01451 family) [Pseudoduganella lurida]|uniref:Putative repeat protein (TIGR01451 family) n=1 Tax=Pseudoduganella lurida TaxID=1036180 RepID=A0A562RLF0_9BURK|nr:DUF11 domain-containing protein [Pseudoduganella lurida]TWI69723.1 putative repeat protein (TIGR01451 family) [Pseudoduganella lurida]
MQALKLPTRLVLAATIFAAAANGANAATAAGTTISNTATATYLDSTLGSHTTTSNTVVTTVQQVASLTMPAGTAKNASAGTQVVYAHSVTNTGNGTDTFALAAANTGTFSMTNVVFYADANGDGVADNATPVTTTGPLATGATFKFVAVGTLPAAPANGTTNTITVTATSGFTNTVTATSVDTTTAASAAHIDITANTAGVGAPGAGAGLEASAVVTNTVAPGGTTRYTLVLNNSGGSPDTFNLQAAVDGTFANLTLPTGWTVVFKDAAGNVITNATVAANSSVQVFADVFVPAGSALGTTDLYFRVMSPTSGVTDKIHNAITIAAAGNQLTLTKVQALDADCNGVADTAYSNAPITTGAIPGACIRYQITATNAGGTDVGAVVIKDDVPANTTYHTTNALAATLGAIVLPLTGPVTTLQANVGTLHTGESSTMSFGVRINP